MSAARLTVFQSFLLCKTTTKSHENYVFLYPFSNILAIYVKYTTSVDIQQQQQKMRYKKPVTRVEPHTSAVSVLSRAENSAI